jgi:hypothetical protein
MNSTTQFFDFEIKIPSKKMSNTVRALLDELCKRFMIRIWILLSYGATMEQTLILKNDMA